MSDDSILIFGGFQGRYMKDAHVFNPVRKEIKMADHQPSTELFLFQMPTVYDSTTGIIYTVDWQKLKIYQFSRNKWDVVMDLRRN